VKAALVHFEDGLRFALAHSPPAGGLEIDRPWVIVPGNADLDFTGPSPCPLVALSRQTAP